MGTGAVDACQLLMQIEGTPCLRAKVGTKQLLPLSEYFGAASNLTYTDVMMTAEAMSELGIAEALSTSYGKLQIECTKSGAARIRITAIAVAHSPRRTEVGLDFFRNFVRKPKRITAMKKFWSVVAALLLVALAAFVYLRFYFVFGEGVKSGELNYVVYKGLVFKTYEGKLIQSGLRSKAAGTVQSYEFEFSVEDPRLARELMLRSGETLELHYREYFGALPWRGFTEFIVDSIVSVRPVPPAAVPAPLPDGPAASVSAGGES